MFRRNWKTEMTAPERRRGLVFFLLYLFVFPYLNTWMQRRFMGEGEVLVAEANVIYYLFLFVLVLFIFWGFLRRDLSGLLDWLPENLFSVAIGFLGAGGLHVLVSVLPYPVADPIGAQYAAQFRAAPVPTLVLVLVLIPVVEEVVFRALVFGHLRSYSPLLGAVVSAVLYAVAQVWRYALEFRDPRYLLLALLYLPMSAGLTWCYDRGGSVWAAMALHGGLNGFILFMAL